MTWFPAGGRGWRRALVTWGAFSAILLAAGWRMLSMPGRSYAGPLPPLSPAEADLRERLERHVRRLASGIGERNLWNPARLEAAARHAEEALRSAGAEPRIEAFELPEPPRGPVRNVLADLPGASRPSEIVVVGAHYDSVQGSPGANDNATGTAAALEIARLLAGRPLARTVRIALFVNEEPPFFQTDGMGSLVHARGARRRGERIVSMLSLETIGCYRDEPGSQRYPIPIGFAYPDRGNFIAFLGDLGARGLVRDAVSAFRRRARFPSEGAALPGWVPGVGWSDHWAFREMGYPAAMVTDTALFRSPHYHTEGDTPEKIDFDRMARVVAGIRGVVEELAGGPAAAAR